MTIRDLKEKRSRNIATMRDMLGSGELSPENQQKFDALKAEVVELETNIARQEFLDDAERRMEGKPIGATGDDRFDAALKDFSIRRAIAAQDSQLARQIDCGREIELSAELQRRAGKPAQGMTVPLSAFRQPVEERVVTSTGSGSLIGTDHLGNQFIDTLRAKLVTRQLGARFLDGLQGNVEIPRRTASANVNWFAENAATTASDFTIDKITLTPKHVGGFTEVSRNLLLQSSPDVEQIVRDDFANLIAVGLDTAALSTGGTNAPTGIRGQTNVLSVAQTTAPTWATITTAVGKIDSANALSGSLGWAVNPWTMTRARQQPKSTAPGDGYVVENDPNTLAGYRSVSTNILPGQGSSTASSVVAQNIFGNWNELLVGTWSNFDILANPYEGTAFAKGNIQVRAMATADVQVRHPESFVVVPTQVSTT